MQVLGVEYWLDTAALVEPKKRGYDFELQPGYWVVIDQQLQAGRMAIPRMVYDEIATNATLPDGTKDELAQWLAARAQYVCPEPDQAIQQSYGEIAAYVDSDFPKQRAKFLGGADGWVIAHARVQGGTVVTLETLDPNQAKIPTLCRHFDIPCINPWQMLRALGISFTLSA